MRASGKVDVAVLYVKGFSPAGLRWEDDRLETRLNFELARPHLSMAKRLTPSPQFIAPLGTACASQTLLLACKRDKERRRKTASTGKRLQLRGVSLFY